MSVKNQSNFCFTIETELEDLKNVEFEISVTYGGIQFLSASKMTVANKTFTSSIISYPRNNGYGQNLTINVKETIKDSENFSNQSANKAIVSNVASMLDDPQFSDFKFIINEKEFKVHKCILAAASDVFVRIFKTNKLYWKINDIDEATFEHLLRFIYGGKVPDNLNEIAIKMFEAAAYFKIDRLKEMCSKKIHAKLSVENALETYNWAFVYDLEVLKTKAWELVKR